MTGKDWKRVYRADLRATSLENSGLIRRLRDRRFKFYKSLRKTEYYTNYRHDFLGQIIGKILRFRHDLLCTKYNWIIPINVFDEGLAIVHVGSIVVSGSARVGKNCRIHICTNIGHAPSKEGTGAPILGDNVYIGPGAKLFGAIRIGNNTAIGGIPAKKISDKTSLPYIHGPS